VADQHGPQPGGAAGKAWRPRLVALDIDGTLPRWAEVEGPAAEPADGRLCSVLHAALDTGAHIVLCSGRSGHGMTRVIDRLGLTGQHRERMWMVASNGAALYRYAPLEIARRETFDAAPAVLAFLSRCPSALVAVELDGVGYRLTAPFPAGELPGELIVTELAQLLVEPVNRVVIRDPAATPDDFIRLAGEIELPGANHTVGWSAWLDLTPAGVTKVSGLRHVCAELGVHKNDVLAIGDGHNDIGMLRWAGRGVAMGQATAEVREAADSVTAAVDDDGVVLELERWFG
jgi:HAD superfamily hydrolase (TIGR01484 family)